MIVLKENRLEVLEEMTEPNPGEGRWPWIRQWKAGGQQGCGGMSRVYVCVRN